MAIKVKNLGQVGPQILADGSMEVFRLGNQGETVVQNLHGSRYEQCYRGNLFAYGDAQTAGNANSNYTATVTATAQPVIGVWNPLASNVNLVILRVQTQVLFTPANTTNVTGAFMYLSALKQSAITTGASPWNLRTLKNSGSKAKAFANTIALTGLVGSLSVMFPVGVSTLCAGQPTTAAAIFNPNPVDEIDGGIIVPPGGVLVVMYHDNNSTYSCGGAMMWEEVPV